MSTAAVIPHNAKRTLAFRRFRRKLHELSTIYWTSQVGSDGILKLLSDRADEAFTVDEIGCTFELKMYPRKVAETREWLPVFMERTRLHILVLTAASLESYLHEAIFIHLAATGYVVRPTAPTEALKLNAVGEAIGKPILGRSSLPEPLKYAEQLLTVSFGTHRETWVHAYKIRCIAAHTGGMVNSRHLRDIPNLDYDEFDMIGLEWDELRLAMNAADQIATIIDERISSPEVCLIEAEQLMRIMKAKETLPARQDLWQFMHDKHKILLKRAYKNDLERMFY